jgi:hypothetical protein
MLEAMERVAVVTDIHGNQLVRGGPASTPHGGAGVETADGKPSVHVLAG